VPELQPKAFRRLGLAARAFLAGAGLLQGICAFLDDQQRIEQYDVIWSAALNIRDRRNGLTPQHAGAP